MKKRTLLFGMGLLLMSALAYAETVTMKANIPFSFIVGKTTLPAGEYAVEGLGLSGNVISIRKLDNTVNSLTMSIPCESPNAAQQSKLVFRRYGERYFLMQIWTAGSNSGRQFLKSRREAEMALDYQAQEVVLVASRR